MLTYEQIKAMENSLGPEKAGPIIEAFEVFDERLKDSLATRQDLLRLEREIELLRGDLKRDLEQTKAELQTTIKDLEVRLTVRMGAMLAVVLAVVAALKLL